MKDFTELTEKEIFNLTSEDLQLYCNIALMKEGVIKPIEPIPPKIEQLNISFKEYYCVKIDYYKSIIFERLEEAQQFADLNPKILDTIYDFPEPYTSRAKSPNDITIEKIRVVSEDDVIKYRPILARQKKETQEYETLKKEYNKENEATQEIIDDVYNIYYAAKRKHDRLLKIKNTWEEYLKLTNNDSSIAFEFLKKAYPIDEISEAQKWFDLTMK